MYGYTGTAERRAQKVPALEVVAFGKRPLGGRHQVLQATSGVAIWVVATGAALDFGEAGTGAEPRG